MKIKKEGSAGVTLLICLLFVLVVVMAVWMLLDKTNIIQNINNNVTNNAGENVSNENNGQANNADNINLNENSVKDVVADKFEEMKLQLEGVTGCNVKSIEELASADAFIVYLVKYEIEYNDNYIGIEREAGKWSGTGSCEVLVEKVDNSYKIVKTGGGIAYSIVKDVVADKFEEMKLQLEGVTGCNVKSIEELKSKENLTVYSIDYEIEYNDNYIGIEREAGKWSATGSCQVLVEKVDNSYKIVKTGGGLLSDLDD